MKARTNDERADKALDALAHYADICNDRVDGTDVVDLLTDLMHLCDREEVDFDMALRDAQMNFEAECEEAA